MRCMLLVTLALLCAVAAQAQRTLDPAWVLRRASPLGHLNAEAWGVDVDAQGNLLWLTNRNRAPGQGLDLVLYTLSTTGDELWPEPYVYGGDFAQQGYIVTAGKGVVYTAGRTCRASTLNLDSCDMLITAVDAATGRERWATVWDGGYGYEEADGLVPFGDSLYVTGWTMGDSTHLDLALLILRPDSGQVLRAQVWGTPATDHQDGHIVVDDSAVYVAGLYNGEPNSFIGYSGFNGRALTAKFSRRDLSFLDSATTGRNDKWTNFENALGMAGDDTSLYVTGITTTAHNDNQIFTAKYDKALRLLWYRTFGGTGTESARSVAVHANGDVYVGGLTDSYGAGDYDVVLLRYDAEGTLLDSAVWGGAGKDEVRDMALHGDTLYIAGNTSSFSAGATTEAFLLRIDLQSAVSVQEAGAAVEQPRFAPHPVTTHAEFILPGDVVVHNAVLELCTPEGRVVRTERFSGTRHTFRRGALPPGVYAYTLTDDSGGIPMRGLVVLR